jgi:hypothetical protein
MELDTEYLLAREDFREFHLTREEIMPLMPDFNRQCEAWLKENPTLNLDGNPTEEEKSAFGSFFLSLIQRMIRAIFNPKRIQDLIIRLKKYRNERFDAGDSRAAGATMGAIISLEREETPEDNRFLNALCYYGFKSSTKSASQSADDQE